MSLADNIKQMRTDGCTEEVVYTVMITAALQDTVAAVMAAILEVDGETENLHEKTTLNVAAAAIKVSAAVLAKRDVDVTVHYLAAVASLITTDAPVDPSTPDTSKLN